MFSIIPSNRFKKDLKTAKKRGFNLDLLNEIVETLAADKPLDKKHHDHPLTGNFTGFRECHIQPDWLLIYKIERNELLLMLLRTGTHSDLFD